MTPTLTLSTLKRPAFIIACALALSACSWFGDSSQKHMTQKEQWEALGYKDGLKSVKQGP